MSMSINSYGTGTSATPLTKGETAALSAVAGMLLAIGVLFALVFGLLEWLTVGLLLIAAMLLLIPGYMGFDDDSGAGSGGGGGGASACYWLALLLIIGTAIYGYWTMPPTSKIELIDCFQNAGYKVQCADDTYGTWEQRREFEKQFQTLHMLEDEILKRYCTTFVYELMLDDQKPFIALRFHTKSDADKAVSKFPGALRFGQWVFLNTTSTTAAAIRRVI